MIESIISTFQDFRNRLFLLFPYRRDATMDLIDAVSAETSTSIVKLSLSDLFRRKYSSITDVLDSLFRSNLKTPSTQDDLVKQKLKVTQLLAEKCPQSQKNGFALFAIDCSANPRIFADKVPDRTIVHAPNHVPGQKPITVGHEYSVLVHLPSDPIDRELHWVIPLSTRRVQSNESGPQVGLAQLEEIATATVFRDQFCVSVTDAAYGTQRWIIGVSKLPNVVNIARMRSNRKVYRLPPQEGQKKKGRPLIYGEEIPLSAPPQPDLQEITTVTTRKGHIHQVRLDRWNDIIVRGSDKERTHEHPFDLVRVTVIDGKGKPVYKRPLWVMVTGARRREVTSFQAFDSYCRRYDIEHFFRFGKQKLGLVNSQTCDTCHEEGWHWIALLAYSMLYHARQLAQSTAYPWEKKRVRVIAPNQRPSQVQRDYKRIIRGIGTPASIPKPRGKSPGRQLGAQVPQRPICDLIYKKNNESKPKPLTKSSPAKRRTQCLRMRRVWNKDRPAPMRC